MADARDQDNLVARRIAHLDAISPPEYNTNKSRDERTAIQDYLCRRHPTFKLLHDIRMEGWKEKTLDRVYEKKLVLNNVTSSDKEEINSRNMADEVMQDIIRSTQWCPARGAMTWLDLGAAPGGFSTCILRHNPDAQGTGFTLPHSQGGYKLLIPEDLMGRYRAYYGDLLTLDLFGQNVDSEDRRRLPSTPFPVNSAEKFDAVIVAARLHNDQSTTTRKDPFDVLHIIQLVIALQYVKPKTGRIIVREKTPDYPQAIRLFADFEPFCGKIEFAKSDRFVTSVPFASQIRFLMLAHRGWVTSSFCYFIASEVDTESDACQKLLNYYLDGLQDHFLGRCENVEPLQLNDQELIDSGVVDRCVAARGEQVWQVHAKGLSNRLNRQRYGNSGRGFRSNRNNWNDRPSAGSPSTRGRKW